MPSSRFLASTASLDERTRGRFRGGNHRRRRCQTSSTHRISDRRLATFEPVSDGADPSSGLPWAAGRCTSKTSSPMAASPDDHRAGG